MHPFTKKTVPKIGAEKDDFEVDVVTVVIHRSIRDRCVDTAWTVTATLVAVTVAQMLIIPLFA